MNKTLLIDFGASRIKSIYLFSKNNLFYENKGSIVFHGKKYDPRFYYKKLKEHLNYYLKKKIEFREIYVCSEMHGFFLLNKKKKKYTQFYSWRFKSKKKNNSKKINYLKKNLLSKTGLLYRDGLPIINYYKENLNKRNYDLIGGVSESLCYFGGDLTNNISLSYAHSTGFYNMKGLMEKKIKFKNKVCSHLKTNIGNIFFNKKKINIICGIGDMQAAFIGSYTKKNDVLINMGTGSQIISQNLKLHPILKETRPISKTKILYCITHIPSGRSMIEFKKKILSKKKIKINFWKTMALIKERDIYKANLKLDLKNFILKNREINSIVLSNNIKNLCSIFLKNYIYQYLDVINLCKKKFKKFKINLAGGIPNKLTIIKSIIRKETSLKIYTKKDSIDQTLIGLLKIKNGKFL